MEEPDSYEHGHVELSDDEQEPVKQKLSSSSDNSENEDSNDDDESSDSDSSEVCGAFASNKFAVLDMSD